ncbi:MAG: redoxin domain-containing protein [Ilumatobacteraceae bacterium]
MSRRVRWFVVAVLVAVAAVGVMASRRTTPAQVADAAGQGATSITVAADVPVLSDGPAPSIEANDGWLNTTPLTDADLAGKVVLYDFWTFGCINCQHTLPHVTAWQQRYAADGLVILSIHTPEFDYEADAGNVAEFVAGAGIEYPVALDPDRDVWHAWDNHYWPAFYLYDGEGRLRVQHFGEGAYDSTEDAIRALLGVDPDSPRAVVR